MILWIKNVNDIVLYKKYWFLMNNHSGESTIYCYKQETVPLIFSSTVLIQLYFLIIEFFHLFSYWDKTQKPEVKVKVKS